MIGLGNNDSWNGRGLRKSNTTRRLTGGTEREIRQAFFTIVGLQAEV
jgi:hypothetical protein